jgi:hypothetical protein
MHFLLIFSGSSDVKLMKIYKFETDKKISSDYIFDELYLLIKDLQHHFSSYKITQGLKGEAATMFNEVILTFFRYIDYIEDQHLKYLSQKLGLPSYPDKTSYVNQMEQLFKEEDEINSGKIDFRLRTIVYLFKYYHSSLKPEIKQKIKNQLIFLFDDFLTRSK